MGKPTEHTPYVSDEARVAEFTLKAVLFGGLFGILFGASTVYLALRSGLTVSASIPIAVLAIALLKRLGGSTILENNLVQTIGSAGESIAAGVVFTLPGFLFLSPGAGGAGFFHYWTIFTLSLVGGLLGILMMIPLRRALIVKEHGVLPYPEGTACAAVLIAGERGGAMARTAYLGLACGLVYAVAQLVLRLIAEAPTWVSGMKSKVFPAATLSANITPEYLGVGYILGARNAGLLVAGSTLSWLVLIPLLASVVPQDTIANELVKLGYLADLTQAGAYGWDPNAREFTQLNRALYFAYIRQIGAGMVAAGGFITLLRTLPTILRAFKGAMAGIKGRAGGRSVRRTERDLPLGFVALGSLGLVAIVAVLPFLPGHGGLGQVLLGALIVVFGFFFVTVSSRIVGIIGSTSNPVSGMTIAAIMITCLLFVSLGWTGDVYQPMALCVGSMVCIAAANAGATSQDLKTGFLVGATPRHQQVGLMIGAIVAAVAIGVTMQVLDNAHVDAVTGQWVHAIGGERYSAPQGTLMATLIKGLLARNLDWQFVLAGVFAAVAMELCSVRSLAFAVGAYLPLATTLPIFLGGVVRWAGERASRRGQGAGAPAEELEAGNLFATGLVAGGAMAGVLVAIVKATADRYELQGHPTLARLLEQSLNQEGTLVHALGQTGYEVLGAGCFVLLGGLLFWMAFKGQKKL